MKTFDEQQKSEIYWFDVKLGSPGSVLLAIRFSTTCHFKKEEEDVYQILKSSWCVLQVYFGMTDL